ncbi:Sugar transport protein 14 [Stylosanthes scabra]|uniref:Sugar transport protein 14 n=1 Tax=Stylosanthes scabra TaxID=79078 RepID=A0ABU6S8A1_9FABA|nr:Sugar transport protein 14 [Stylosanthes scabra]
MAGGVVDGGPAKRAHLYEHKFTHYFAFTCFVGALGGSLFGYDLGVSGGVTSMDDFLVKFFPDVYKRKHEHLKETDYCKYDNQLLTLFTSSLYFSALVMTFFASYVTRKKGRKASIIVGGLSFLAGAILNAAAENITMLIIGRILLGGGIGFGNQAVPLYLSEMAPAKNRGAVNQLFQFTTCFGILVANLINYFTDKMHPNGWRVSLGLAAIPATLMLLGGIFCAETPNSLVEQGRFDEARKVLERVRGTTNVDAEYQDLVEASEEAQAVTSPFRTLLKRKYRPQLVIGALGIPAFQQLTGNNSILFYAPVIFQSVGFGANAALFSSFITNGALLVATVISMFLVDKFGRRKFFLEAGFEMICCMIATAVALAVSFGDGKELSKGSIVVCVNMIFTALVAQLFLMSLCHLKYGIFLLFAALIVIMSLFIFFLLPETKQVPIEEIYLLFENHWFWKSIVGQRDQHQVKAAQV